MIWLLLGGLVAAIAAAVGYVVWRKWIAPWRQIEQLVEQIGRGERPRTFLIGGADEPRRAALALEGVFSRGQELVRQIAKREAGTQTIFASMHDGLLVVDSKRRIVLANETFRRLFALPALALGEPLLEVVREATLDRAITHALGKSETSRDELAVADSTGSPPRRIELNAVPAKNEVGETTGAVVLFHDITELKRVDQMRRDFVANVSHELRTPLSILRGYIETLIDDPQISREESSRILGVMEKHSRRLGLLLDDLLALAQLESGSWKLKLAAVDPARLFGEIMRDWEKEFAKKQLRIAVDVPEPRAVIQADEMRLRQALDNLLDNAVKYTGEQGEIRLRAEWRSGEAALSVSDSGIGIGEDDLPRIFERFYRVDQARSRELGGTGLGLAIVKHIAQLHGGRVESESAPGKGTIIRLLLPQQRTGADLPVTQT